MTDNIVLTTASASEIARICQKKVLAERKRWLSALDKLRYLIPAKAPLIRCDYEWVNEQINIAFEEVMQNINED